MQKSSGRTLQSFSTKKKQLHYCWSYFGLVVGEFQQKSKLRSNFDNKKQGCIWEANHNLQNNNMISAIEVLLYYSCRRYFGANRALGPRLSMEKMREKWDWDWKNERFVFLSNFYVRLSNHKTTKVVRYWNSCWKLVGHPASKLNLLK